MLPIQTILHPTDFSECADAALRLAQVLAREQGARLVLLHVRPVCTQPGPQPLLMVEPRVLSAALEDRRARGSAAARYPVETVLRDGDPVEEIVRLAAEREAGLIVMGSHGRSGFARWLLGSVAEGVLRKAHCPVLNVKTPLLGFRIAEGREASARAGTWRPRAQPPAPPALEPEPARVIVEVCEGTCRGIPLTRVHHRTFPEIWAEADTMAAAIAQVVGKLISARESCASQWQRDMLAQAITDVRTYNPSSSPRRVPLGEATRSRLTQTMPPVAQMS